MCAIKIEVFVNKDELEALYQMHKELLSELRWTGKKYNPFHRIQRAMYASTMGKFAAEGISAEGSKRAWPFWTENYREFRVRTMKQPTPILRLAGSYTSKGGKTRSYNLRLIKSIKKSAPNKDGKMLSTGAIHAMTHQYGDQRSARRPASWKKRISRFLKKKFRLTGRRATPSLRATLERTMRRKARGKKQRNIPPRPFFLWTVTDIKMVEAIFSQYFMRAIQKKVGAMRAARIQRAAEFAQGIVQFRGK